MEFAPKSTADIVSDMVWPKGEYDFEVIAAKEKVSSRGNEMFEVHLRISDTKGNSKVLKDYLLPKFALKFKGAAEAMGLESEYQQGCIDEDDFIGKRGRVKVLVEKDRTKQFPPKNVIDAYLKSWRSAA